MEYGVLILAAFVIEVLVEIVKPLTRKVEERFETYDVNYLTSIILSTIAVFAFDLNLIRLMGAPQVGVLGNIVTALLISRGSNYLHNVLGKSKGSLEALLPLLFGSVFEGEEDEEEEEEDLGEEEEPEEE